MTTTGKHQEPREKRVKTRALQNQKMTLLPESIPLEPDLTRNLERIRPSSQLNDIIKKAKATILSNVEDVVDSIGSVEIKEQEEQLQKLVDRYKLLISRGQDFNQFSNALNEAKGIIRNQAGSESLTMESLQYYKGQEGARMDQVFKQTLEESRVDEESQNETFKRDKNLNFIQNASFILSNPEAPLPQEGDDELEMEGGKIELTCPLTMALFETPMISKKCGHTFDKAALDDQFRTARDVPCPVAGCIARSLSRTDFEEDRVMKLRVRVYKACGDADQQQYDEV